MESENAELRSSTHHLPDTMLPSFQLYIKIALGMAAFTAMLILLFVIMSHVGSGGFGLIGMALIGVVVVIGTLFALNQARM